MRDNEIKLDRNDAWDAIKKAVSKLSIDRDRVDYLEAIWREYQDCLDYHQTYFLPAKTHESGGTITRSLEVFTSKPTPQPATEPDRAVAPNEADYRYAHSVVTNFPLGSLEREIMHWQKMLERIDSGPVVPKILWIGSESELGDIARPLVELGYVDCCGGYPVSFMYKHFFWTRRRRGVAVGHSEADGVSKSISEPWRNTHRIGWRKSDRLLIYLVDKLVEIKEIDTLSANVNKWITERFEKVDDDVQRTQYTAEALKATRRDLKDQLETGESPDGAMAIDMFLEPLWDRVSKT